MYRSVHNEARQMVEMTEIQSSIFMVGQEYTKIWFWMRVLLVPVC